MDCGGGLDEAPGEAGEVSRGYALGDRDAEREGPDRGRCDRYSDRDRDRCDGWKGRVTDRRNGGKGRRQPRRRLARPEITCRPFPKAPRNPSLPVVFFPSSHSCRTTKPHSSLPSGLRVTLMGGLRHYCFIVSSLRPPVRLRSNPDRPFPAPLPSLVKIKWRDIFL